MIANQGQGWRESYGMLFWDVLDVSGFNGKKSMAKKNSNRSIESFLHTNQPWG
jgi:hypothetical protein